MSDQPPFDPTQETPAEYNQRAHPVLVGIGKVALGVTAVAGLGALVAGAYWIYSETKGKKR